MSDTYQAIILSGSTGGLPIPVNATTSSSANTVHIVHAVNIDELWLGAYNYSNNDVDLSLYIGSTNANQIMTITIPSKRGILPIFSGFRFTGGVTIKAFASITGSLAVVGNVNRIVFI